jgi:hypothetical protein
MGFFDRFASKKPDSAATPPASAPSSPPPSSIDPTTPLSPELAPTAAPSFAANANLKAQLLAAREKLEAKDLAGAQAIYEELLRVAGDRPDVLVAISGDLGSCGYVTQIVELIAPRYDAVKHGPATGLNLLQAYLATRNPTAAQHLLDILFELKRPELEERLYGFSNALAELLEAERRGELSPATPGAGNADPQAAEKRSPRQISLASISRPIWAYGLEAVPGILPPPKEGRLRRIAFGQLALLGTPEVERCMKEPEDALGRFSRGLPLWLAETFYFSPHYAPIAAVGLVDKDHYAIFPSEWTAENIRQLVESTAEGLDYVFTGALKHRNDDFELLLRVWEVKKFRERKQFSARWTPATADAELAKLHEQIRLFMEFQNHPAGPAYAAPTNPSAWCDTLGASVTAFLADKGVLPKEQFARGAGTLAELARTAASSEKNSLAWLTLADRAHRLGVAELPVAALMETPAVAEARKTLAL